MVFTTDPVLRCPDDEQNTPNTEDSAEETPAVHQLPPDSVDRSRCAPSALNPHSPEEGTRAPPTHPANVSHGCRDSAASITVGATRTSRRSFPRLEGNSCRRTRRTYLNDWVNMRRHSRPISEELYPRSGPQEAAVEVSPETAQRLHSLRSLTEQYVGHVDNWVQMRRHHPGLQRNLNQEFQGPHRSRHMVRSRIPARRGTGAAETNRVSPPHADLEAQSMAAPRQSAPRTAFLNAWVQSRQRAAGNAPNASAPLQALSHHPGELATHARHPSFLSPRDLVSPAAPGSRARTTVTANAQPDNTRPVRRSLHWEMESEWDRATAGDAIQDAEPFSERWGTAPEDPAAHSFTHLPLHPPPAMPLRRNLEAEFEASFHREGRGTSTSSQGSEARGTTQRRSATAATSRHNRSHSGSTLGGER